MNTEPMDTDFNQNNSDSLSETSNSSSQKSDSYDYGASVADLLRKMTPLTIATNETETPGGTRYWRPVVDASIIPIKGRVYESLQKSIQVYDAYAEIGGFDTRKSTQRKLKGGFIREKYVLCSKAGVPKNININTLDPENSDKTVRNTSLQITGCKAHIIFTSIPGSTKYRVSAFVDEHNHMLVPSEYRHLTRKQRQLKYSEQLFILKSSFSNIGGTKAHHFYSNLKGSIKNVHGTALDFKNFKRDINCFIGESDAQMLINKMENRKKYVPQFSFEYVVEDAEFSSMFWADEVAKCNFKEFGDIISFDATYRTNKYNMMFVPFTGIDNHRKCVTIAAGMLKNETAESYIWLLKSFMKAFGKEHIMVVTDQDSSMKKVIAAVFPNSKHRLCMWHITQKLPAKIVPEILDSEFKNRLNKIVWNMYIEPIEFEEKWAKLIEDYRLKDHKWLSKMYDIRSTWIPAYFVNSPLFGLMRTTSRSESENSFFSHFTNHGSTLVNFMICFESAMEKQRYKQETLDFKSMNSAPKFMTPLKIEKHAAKVYTRTIFLMVQKEIHAASWTCFLTEMNTEEGCEAYGVKDEKPLFHALNSEKEQEDNIPPNHEAKFKVLHNKKEGTWVCTCRHFSRFGILCRHIFFIMKTRQVNEIPEKYILRRWTKDLINAELRTRKNRYSEMNEVVENLANEACCTVDECINLLSNDEEKLAAYVEKVKALKTELETELPNPTSMNKDNLIERIIGVAKPDKIVVKNPQLLRYKGCGNDNRLKSSREILIENSLKVKRKCGKCGLTTHNVRTCPKVAEEKQAALEKLVAQQKLLGEKNTLQK